MPKGYLRRTCHVCGLRGVVPKIEDLPHMHKMPERWVFWEASPYQQELAGEDWYAWWCTRCIDQDAADI